MLPEWSLEGLSQSAAGTLLQVDRYHGWIKVR